LFVAVSVVVVRRRIDVERQSWWPLNTQHHPTTLLSTIARPLHNKCHSSHPNHNHLAIRHMASRKCRVAKYLMKRC